MMTDFGEVFAVKTLRRLYAKAVFPAITNTNYEGELKEMGDRLNILSFPGDVQLGDYVSGSDMDSYEIYDKEDQLVVEKRKYYNFPIDRLEDLFTYVDDEDDTLTESAEQSIERNIDKYVLEQAQFGKAGSWVGIDMRVVGSSRDTEASVTTTATGGTIGIQCQAGIANNYVAPVEHGDGTLDYGGFDDADIGKPIRLTSGTTWATEWYRITGVTDTLTATVENWDGAVDAMDIPNGDVLRGLHGAFAFTGGDINGDGKPTTEGGWGWELQAARGTTLTNTVIYEQMTLLAEKLDDNEIPDVDRHVTGPPAMTTLLRQAAELQPAISMAYENVVLNGRVGRVAGFDIHQAVASRVSTRLEHPTAAGEGADCATTEGSRCYQILGNHIGFCTFAYKWAENRVVDAEDQFSKKFQGLHLFGAKVPGIRRKSGAVLFGKL